jgi:hypothetical protein
MRGLRLLIGGCCLEAAAAEQLVLLRPSPQDLTSV